MILVVFMIEIRAHIYMSKESSADYDKGAHMFSEYSMLIMIKGHIRFWNIWCKFSVLIHLLKLYSFP